MPRKATTGAAVGKATASKASASRGAAGSIPAAAIGTGVGSEGTVPIVAASGHGAAEAVAGAEEAAKAEEAARQICLRLLTTAPRTRAQLATALGRRGVPDAAAEAVLGRLCDVGLVDDAMFAVGWVESRHHGRGLAGRVLAAELRRRGVAGDNIRAALDRLEPDQEVATARALVERRIAGTAGQPLATRIRQLIGLLARKGYPQALAYRLVREALEQEGTDPAAAGFDLADPPESYLDEDEYPD
jgi:regulatory protein